MTGGHQASFVREMGYTAGEFAQTLPPAMRDWPVSGGPFEWDVSSPGGSPLAHILIEPQAPRCIGALRLPVLAVTVDLSRAPRELVDEFHRRFERGFHRGGG